MNNGNCIITTGLRKLAHGPRKTDHGRLFGYGPHEPMTTTFRLGYGPDNNATVAAAGEREPRRIGRFERLLLKTRCVAVPADIGAPVIIDARTTSYARDFAIVHDIEGPKAERVPAPSADVSHRFCEPFTVSPTTNLKYSGARPPEPYVPPKSEYWMSHGVLGNRVIAERMHAKGRNKRR
ncbi:Hypothetical protein CINCED_3A014727 [Cinara cedri]|uniref:Uncharacterized protein n=1 Tax=Cinara cedri TaxID=506608 RepID=A0A5E4NT15_9HEMI|nr:Hypothetical protein CINCED_3A014727 [Cinara cedri]